MKLKVGAKYPEYDNYWSMDRISGNSLIDEKGLKNGTISGAVQTEGIKGKALSFDGVDDYVQIPVGLFYVNRSSYSISCWFKLDTLKEMNSILSFGNTPQTGVPNILLRADNADLKTYGQNAGYATIGSVEANKWYHVVITRTSNQEKAYINNILVSTRTIINANGESTNIYFGTAYIGNLDGLIDEVLFYNKVLTEAEIKKIYKIGLNKFKLKVKGNSLNEGLVGYWTMDNVSGSTLNDETGVNNGTIYGATQVDGKIGKALSFDGVDDYVNGGSLGMVRYNNSFSCWIKPNNISATQVIFWESSSGMSLGFYSNGVILRSDDFKRWYTNAGLTNGIWSHIAVNYDTDGQPTLYINGVESSTLNSGTQYFSGSGNFYIGKRSTGSPYKGELDELMIFNRALSQEEINKLYNSGLGKYKPLNNNLVNVPKIDKTGLVARYTMDNISGTTLIDEMGVNNGTISGATQVDGKIGKALSFDGVDDYVTFGKNFVGSMDKFSVSHWIYLDSNQNTRTIFSNYGSDVKGWVTGIKDGDNNKIKFFLGSGKNVFSSYALNIQKWYHVVVTYDAGNPKMYIDGVLDASSSDNITFSSNYYYNTIGCLGNLAQKFDGYIDDVMIFNRALSQEEISYLYNSGKGKYSPFR